jgi:TetR/AcrR family transcriptional regulator, mexJK operon transcriptional repressor
LNEAMFAVREQHDQTDLRRWADEAVRVWLAAYGAATETGKSRF